VADDELVVVLKRLDDIADLIVGSRLKVDLKRFWLL
jgi:hypothetical protein